MCEEQFGGELDVMEVSDDCKKSQARQHRDWLHQLNERDWCSLQKVMDTLKRMEDFCRMKKNMFLPIREGLTVALREMQLLKESMKHNDCYIERLECHLRDKMVQKIKEVRSPKKVVLDKGTQILPKSETRSPGMTIFRGLCVARRFERQPQIGSLEETTKRESKQATT